MKKILFLLISNILFSQSIPEPKSIALTPPVAKLKTDTIDEEIIETYKPFYDTKKHGIGLINYNSTDDGYATGANFFIFNPSTKTIKYIWFTVAGSNPVGDLVKTNVGYYKTLKAIGPIESKSVGKWTFDYVWMTDIVKEIKISTIKIQYMDGTYRTVKYSDQMYIGYSAYENLIIALNKGYKKELNFKTNSPMASKDDNTIFSEVEQSAEFPGGYGSLRKLFVEKLNTSEFITDVSGAKTELSFIIEKDGSISDVKAEGLNIEFNNEAIKTMKSIPTKWSPALINGIKVRSIYKTKFIMK
nr:hypothetical protein [uncultured Chryseobacterium sp.]